MGVIAFCPLAQGLLTSKYLTGIPADSRAAKPTGFLKPEHVRAGGLSPVSSLYASADRCRDCRACLTACPTQAIIFGNINDAGSQVARLKGEPRNYGILTDLNTRPRTSYLAKVRNPNPEIEKG